MYKNFIEHKHYGKLWYVAYIRNWCVMGNTAEQNLEAGPCVVVTLRDFGVVSCSNTLNGAVNTLYKQLDMYRDTESELPPPTKKMSWWKQFKLNRLFKSFDKQGVTNPVDQLWQE